MKPTSKQPVTKKRKSAKEASSPQAQLFRRPPVVTLLGHVDHGKTTLLDRIRQSNLVADEYGGITQNIGAYQVTHQGKAITFIDTPGHAAFTRMRARGAQVTDLVVLIVAANDGVKPQTREALSHIRAVAVPFLVAINKIDLPEANLERVKGQLAETGVVVESYGGETICVEVSAKTGANLQSLLDAILRLAESIDLIADPQGPLEAVVIETRMDKRQGPAATLLVRSGSLHLGDRMTLGGQPVRVRAMSDENRKPRSAAGPGSAVEVFGFTKPPQVGESLGGKLSKPALLTQPPDLPKPKLTKKEIEEEDATKEGEEEKLEEKQTIKVIIKTDVSGTLEAITSNLSEEVEIVGKGIGEVTESDVLLAMATGATIYAFKTQVSKSAQKLAELEKVSIKTYNIVYELFEDLEKRVLKILEPTIDEETIGEAVVIAEFTVKGQRVAGCKVTSGAIAKSSPVHLNRGDSTVADATIRSLRRGEEDVAKVKVGTECGMTFKPTIDFHLGDSLVAYRKVEEQVSHG